MNIYFCHEKGNNEGYYIIASSRGRAKNIYYNEECSDYIDIRCQIIKKDVDEPEGYIEDDDTLRKYDIDFGVDGECDDEDDSDDDI